MMSLTLRLTLLFSLVSAAILFGLSLLIQHSIEGHFAAQDFNELKPKLNQIVNLVKPLPDSTDTTQLAAKLDEIAHRHRLISFRIDTLSRQNLYTSGSLDFPLTSLTPGQVYEAEWSQQGTEFRGTAIAISEETAFGQGVVIAIGITTARHTLFMETFTRQLLSFILIAILLSSLLGWLAVKKGLSPLRMIKSKARAVSAERLDQRLPLESVPTEIADLVNELNLMLDRLEASFSRLTHFSSDIAHELRTPLSNMMTQTQVSLSQSRTLAEYSDILASNLEELERMSRMISDMLFLAKAENGLELPSSSCIDLATEVEKLFNFYEALADEKQIKLQLQGKGTAQGDLMMIDRALSNLISNAIRHTFEGAEIRIDIQTHGDQSLVTICNQGPPISEHDQRYIFDRFYRCDRARAHGSNDGTGLGLPITRAIAHAHGGEVSVCSNTEETCFTLSLPVHNR
jgi:heavy metal sensor kinase